VNGATMKKIFLQRAQRSLIGGLMMVMLLTSVTTARSQTNNYEFNDSHFHLTNNIQEGPNVRDFLTMMGSTVGRATLFGVPQNARSIRPATDYLANLVRAGPLANAAVCNICIASGLPVSHPQSVAPRYS